MRRAVFIVTFLLVASCGRDKQGGISWAQPPAPAAPSCESQLGEAQTQNATVVQLYRDINQQRGGYEVQMAAIRAALGQDCPEAQPVSQCVAGLKAKYVETAQKLVKATTPAPKPAEAPKK